MNAKPVNCICRSIKKFLFRKNERNIDQFLLSTLDKLVIGAIALWALDYFESKSEAARYCADMRFQILELSKNVTKGIREDIASGTSGIIIHIQEISNQPSDATEMLDSIEKKRAELGKKVKQLGAHIDTNQVNQSVFAFDQNIQNAIDAVSTIDLADNSIGEKLSPMILELEASQEDLLNSFNKALISTSISETGEFAKQAKIENCGTK